MTGRMVSNTLGEIRKRADLCDSKGAMLKVDIETETVEGRRRGRVGGRSSSEAMKRGQ